MQRISERTEKWTFRMVMIAIILLCLMMIRLAFLAESSNTLHSVINAQNEMIKTQTEIIKTISFNQKMISYILLGEDYHGNDKKIIYKIKKSIKETK